MLERGLRILYILMRVGHPLTLVDRKERMHFRKTITLLIVLALTATFAAAGGASKSYLTRVENGPDPDARGTIKVKDGSGASLFSVKLKKVDRTVAYGLLIEDPSDPNLFVEFGETTKARKWKVNTAKGDALPLGVTSVADLAGLRLMVTDGDGETILVGTVPDVGETGKPAKLKDGLLPPVPATTDGDVQADGNSLKLRVRNVAAGIYDVCMEDDEGRMQDVGDCEVGTNGEGLWRRTAKKGDPLPFGCGSIDHLFGRRVELRNGSGDVVLAGRVPGERKVPIGGGNGSPNPPAPRGPRLRILITDAPFPFEDVKSAIVSVRRIEIRRVGRPYATLMEWPNGRDLDLVELKNGVVNILYAGDPEPGDYDSIRIIVTAKRITIDNDGVEETYTEFKVPSGEQTGIKVYIKPVVTVVTDLTRDIILDMDLEKSFVVQGNPKTPAGIKGFHFKPVVRAVNRTVAGTLTFHVMSDNGTPRDTTDDFHLNGAAYRVIDTTLTPPADVIASGASGTNPADARDRGYVFHPGVVAGSHKLTVAYRDHDTHEQRVTIHAGNLTDEGTIVLAATAAYVRGTVTTTISTRDKGDLTFVVPDATIAGTLRGDTDPSARDTTSTLGEYALTGLAFGTYGVKATKTGYREATGSSAAWVPGDPNATDLDLKMVPATAGISGTVTDENGAVVEGAIVTILISQGRNGYVMADAKTDASGDWSIDDLPTATYEVVAKIDVSGIEKTASAAVDHIGPTASVVDLTVK